MLFCVWCVFFFFQAEDGIRDLVRSRGLGDVYKRQRLNKGEQITAKSTSESGPNGLKRGRTDPSSFLLSNKAKPSDAEPVTSNCTSFLSSANPVSYTHLTLPTSDLV